MGYNPQESLQNTMNTMGTLLGVHPRVPWIMEMENYPLLFLIQKKIILEAPIFHHCGRTSKLNTRRLVGGWTNPFGQYDRQNGSFPRGENKEIFETTPRDPCTGLL